MAALLVFLSGAVAGAAAGAADRGRCPFTPAPGLPAGAGRAAVAGLAGRLSRALSRTAITEFLEAGCRNRNTYITRLYLTKPTMEELYDNKSNYGFK